MIINADWSNIMDQQVTLLLQNIGLGLLKLMFSCGHNEADAMRLEKFIKKQKSKFFLQKLVNSEPSEFKGILAQLVRCPEISG